MIAIVSDTHANRGHELDGAALEAVETADVVLHAGDFTTAAAYEAWREATATLVAVHGNADGSGVRAELPSERVVEERGIRIALTHRREGGETGLAMFGRAVEADLVISGHTHRPALRTLEDVTLLNPGSHAQPRGNRPGYATLEGGETISVSLRDLDGTAVETVTL